MGMDSRKRLAEAFGAYADRLGLTQTQVAAMGGPSTTSQTKIRTTDEPVSRQTLQKIDYVTGWAPGTSARIIAGDSAPTEQHAISTYSNDELANGVRDLVDEMRRRMTREGGSAADAKPIQKSPVEADDGPIDVRYLTTVRDPAPDPAPDPSAPGREPDRVDPGSSRP